MPTPNPLAEGQFISHWTTTPNPAAGAQATIARPAASHVELIHLHFQLLTDANVANRHVWLSLETAGIVLPLCDALFLHTANTTWTYLTMRGPVPEALVTSKFIHLCLPSLRSFRLTDSYKINVDSIQATDQISDIYAYWKMWRGLS